MKVYQDISSFQVEKPVVTIGSFDGVHLGHLKIIRRLREIAGETGGESVVFTFFPHPRLILFPGEKNLRLLTTLDEKISLLEKAGVEHLVIYPFTEAFSQLSYNEFIRDILVRQLKIKTLVVGYDHKFGKNREGSFEILRELSSVYNFSVEKLDVLLMDHINVSSTKIRNALQNGDLEKANQYLGYAFRLHGHVIEGQKLGRRIQFPTANIQASDPYKIIPAYGVYAVYVNAGGNSYRGMMNIGTRPTVSNADNRSIEVHLIGFEGDLYNQPVEIEFIRKIREERKFGSVEELRAQLEKDKQTVLELLNEL
ncbi:MAG: bifunctional riboflavin kinase/FAD synthetase [Prolixibacteraceae bacterium]